MTDPYFVFRHSLSVISDFSTYALDEIFGHLNKFDIEHEILGNPCLFKTSSEDEALRRGYLIIDMDFDPTNLPTNYPMKTITFPKAEYHFILHKGTFREISTTYDQIQIELEKENLNAVNHPILIFPRGIPETMDTNTLIEIWTATDADYQSDVRLSDRIRLALPRQRFNFYTW